MTAISIGATSYNSEHTCIDHFEETCMHHNYAYSSTLTSRLTASIFDHNGKQSYSYIVHYIRIYGSKPPRTVYVAINSDVVDT